MQNLLTLNQATSCSNDYLFYSVMVFTIIFCGFRCLIDVMAGNPIDMSYLLFEVSNMELKDHASAMIHSALIFNNLTDKYNLTMSAELWESFRTNVNTVHFFVIHGSVVRFVLFTINPDLSINIYAEAIINQHTIAPDLTIMKAQFITALNTLLAANGAIQIKITIFINNVENLLLRPPVFLPIADFMPLCPCSLFYHVFGYPEITNYISDISNNLPAILHNIQILITRCNDLFDIATSNVAVPDDANAELLWYVIQGENLVIRYLEAVYSAYAPIQALDSYVSFAMEGD